MARQYKSDGLSFEVDLCFLVHKLVAEIDEDGRIRQKLIENLGFIFVRISSDVNNFDLQIARIYYYIKESSVKPTVNSAEKSLKERFAKELLSYM